MAAKLMTKTQLANHIATRFSLSKKAANEFLDELASVAVAQTKKVGAFTLPGIGKLVKANRKARMGRICDRRNDQNPGQDCRQIPRGQGRQGLQSSAEG